MWVATFSTPDKEWWKFQKREYEHFLFHWMKTKDIDVETGDIARFFYKKIINLSEPQFS